MADILHAIGELNNWALLLIVLLIGCFMRSCLIIIARFYRLIMVSIRGWPPMHLDADGDWKPEPEKDEDE